ncbi:enoyl-CoA hydratase/isomerase family protein [Natrinema sp. SYSU A 869]|uniref:enoyl-CoA hydratase/isomerase family protein n=1 Tax=Natrinema sp. SYSU A 869 TaxID=2871694 RepID=UPI001CA43356|nr:enoyl-CoA hydratase/isomerase family protein [Natrinema sp. SYSU A 869]
MTVLEREPDGEILRLTLSRPEKLNALNERLLSELVEALREASGEYTVVVIEGAGDAFTAGADLDEDSVGTERIGLFQKVTRAARAFDGIVIGKLHGYAIGGGFELTFSFDLRYAQERTTFRLTESEIGVTVSNATSRLLPLLVGDGRAREIVFTGRPIEAAEAADIGLVSGVYSEGRLEEAVHDVAHDIVENKSRKALRYNKDLFNSAVTVDRALDYEELRNAKLREESDEFSQSSPD